MRLCMVCEESLTSMGAFRLRIGAVDYGEDCDAIFVQERCDAFRDGDRTKWLCRLCAEQHDVFVDDLEYESCGAVEGNSRCGQGFEPSHSIQSETVILLEWGELTNNTSGKGPKVSFCAEAGGHIHFNCACEAWGIPLWSLDAADTP